MAFRREATRQSAGTPLLEGFPRDGRRSGIHESSFAIWDWTLGNIMIIRSEAWAA
jgi:hypothetical protein